MDEAWLIGVGEWRAEAGGSLSFCPTWDPDPACPSAPCGTGQRGLDLWHRLCPWRGSEEGDTAQFPGRPDTLMLKPMAHPSGQASRIAIAAGHRAAGTGPRNDQQRLGHRVGGC